MGQCAVSMPCSSARPCRWLLNDRDQAVPLDSDYLDSAVGGLPGIVEVNQSIQSASSSSSTTRGGLLPAGAGLCRERQTSANSSSSVKSHGSCALPSQRRQPPRRQSTISDLTESPTSAKKVFRANSFDLESLPLRLASTGDWRPAESPQEKVQQQGIRSSVRFQEEDELAMDHKDGLELGHGIVGNDAVLPVGRRMSVRFRKTRSFDDVSETAPERRMSIAHDMDSGLKTSPLLAPQTSPRAAPDYRRQLSTEYVETKQHRKLKRSQSVIGQIGRRPSMALMMMIENPRDINEVYHITKHKKTLGKGSFGTVKRTKVRATGAVRAVKSIEKGDISEGLRMLKTEIKLTKMVDHPHIVKLYEIFEDALNLYLVMELCSGGQLLKRVNDTGVFTEPQAAQAMQQVLRAVLYLHNTQIVHRDLKPENVLILAESWSARMTLKVTDFGVSCQFKPQQVLQARVGTAAYMAPEVIRKSYDERCDFWSCGILMYFLFCDDVPFDGRDNEERYKHICEGKFTFGHGWVDASQDSMDVVSRLLDVDPSRRLTALQALKHNWFSTYLPEVERPPLSLSLFSSLCVFKEQSKFIRASFCLIASLLSLEQLSFSDEAFRILDTDGDGIVTSTDMKDNLRARLSNKDLSRKDRQDAKKMLRDVESKVIESYTYTEFLAATFDRRKYLQEAVCKAAFTAFDQDCNGTVTLEELASGSLLGSLKTSELKKLVDECDTNGDGEIDFKEYLFMMRRAL